MSTILNVCYTNINVNVNVNINNFFSDRHLCSFFKFRLPKFVEAWSAFEMLCEERYFPRPHSHQNADLTLKHSKFIHPLMLSLLQINVTGMAQVKETGDFQSNYLPKCMNCCDSTAVQFCFPFSHFQCLEQPVIQCGCFQLSMHLLRSIHIPYFRKTFGKKKGKCRC